MTAKTIIIACTMIFSISWTLLASSFLLPKMPSNGYFCQMTKYEVEYCQPFSYIKLSNLLQLTNIIIGVISIHAIIGSALGFLVGLIVYVIRGRMVRNAYS